MGWMLVAALGLVAMASGLLTCWRRYRRGRITRRYLSAIVVGCVCFVAYAVVGAFRPEFASGPVAMALLLPAFIAIVVIVREHRRAMDPR